MSIDPKLLLGNFPAIMGTLSLLIVGKTVLVALVGRLFGISPIAAIRVGLLLAPGGEFAFVAFGEAVNQVIFLNLVFFKSSFILFIFSKYVATIQYINWCLFRLQHAYTCHYALAPSVT